jgi:hypothetical protein
LGYTFGNGELSIHDLLQEDHLSPGVRSRPFAHVKDGADSPAKATPRALDNRLALLFVKL